MKSSSSILDQWCSVPFDTLQQWKGRDWLCLYWKTENWARVTQPALFPPAFNCSDLPSGGGGLVSNDYVSFKQRAVFSPNLFVSPGLGSWAGHFSLSTKNQQPTGLLLHRIWVWFFCQEPTRWKCNSVQEQRKKSSQSAISKSCYLTL